MCTYKKIICGVLGSTLVLGSVDSIPTIVKAEMSFPYKRELKRATIITKENYGEHFHIPMGQFLSVSLSENPTMGYRWTQINANDRLLLVGEHFSSTNIGEGDVGKSGIRTFQFKATTLGVMKLQLKQWHSGEGGSSIIDTFYVWVHIYT